MQEWNISLDRIKGDLEELARFNRTPGEGITRVALSEEDMEARAYMIRRMEETGLTVSSDGAGNIYGTLPGRDRALSPVWAGSHIDSVLNGGAFDGNAGVVSALEAVRLIREGHTQAERDITVVIFTSEEPTRYGMGCIGSRFLAGKLDQASAEQLPDEEGVSLAELLNKRGYGGPSLDSLKKSRGDVYAFVELHIEQAEQLERLGCPIGVVQAIAAPTDIQVSVFGRQQHAGSTLMDIRKDAMTAAAELVLEIERAARSYENPYTVATVGEMVLYPNSSNVIPGQADFTIDIRSDRFEEKEGLLKTLREAFARVEEQRGVRVEYKILCHDRPALGDEGVLSAIRQACDEAGLPYHNMTSGAYHDAMLVADFAPFGMIFVPSKDGISHDRREWTDYAQIADGAKVLTGVLWQLANQK